MGLLQMSATGYTHFNQEDRVLIMSIVYSLVSEYPFERKFSSEDFGAFHTLEKKYYARHYFYFPEHSYDGSLHVYLPFGAREPAYIPFSLGATCWLIGFGVGLGIIQDLWDILGEEY